MVVSRVRDIPASGPPLDQAQAALYELVIRSESTQSLFGEEREIMIKPHGSDTLNPLYVQDDKARAELMKEAEGLPSIVVCSAAAANAVMMAGGYFNPLTGYMNRADALSVAEKMETTSGLFFPVPILNMVEDASPIQDAKR
jgi:hypothetical protein